MSNAKVTVIGAGSIGGAVAKLAVKAGAEVQVLARDVAKAAEVDSAVTAGKIGEGITGDIVVVALPYGAYDEVLTPYAAALNGKIVVDPSNPIDFNTGDSVITPAGSSAAALLADKYAGSRVVKAFNTNFAGTLAAGTVGEVPTTVLVAGDDADAKDAVRALVTAGGLRVADAGGLQRAHELESIGAVQIGLAASGQVQWTNGFAVVA